MTTTGSLLRIDAEMANAIPSGYSHVGFVVPPHPNRSSPLATPIDNAVGEHDYEVVELGKVGEQQRLSGGPFMGVVNEEGGANTASTRSRFSVYSADPESPVHTRSRYTRMFSWHNQALSARRNGKVNQSV